MGKIRNFFGFFTLFFLMQVGIVFILNYMVEDVQGEESP